MALFTTVTSEKPAPWTFLRSTEAPMAEEPMPASQAKTMEWIGPSWRAAVPDPTSAEEIEDFLPLFASISAVAAVRSPSSFLSSLSRKEATRNDTVAARTTDSVTPMKLLGGTAAQTAMIEPGDAGERRPEPKTTFVATPVMPPRITAATSLGFISTYGK